MIELGQVILVTGASGAIGFEIAAQAAALGAVVGVHGSREQRVEQAVGRLRKLVPGANPISAAGDFREPGVVSQVVDKVAAEAGGLDAVIHCAITGAPGTTGLFADTDPEQYGRMAELVLGTFQRLTFAAERHMARRNGGRGGTVISFISDAGRFSAPHQAILGAAFAGIIGFVRNVSLESAREGIRIHCISPSYVVDTPVFERRAKRGRTEAAAKRAGLGLPAPTDIAPVALFLCGPGAAKMTGQVISINGGLNA
jgi:3-oxoacyl-[acyl-carrier protein] reductase